MKVYRVVEIFRTVQGEGFHAGTPAVFVRFAGCNLWSGHDEDRARDAERSGAACPVWCDTDFARGVVLDADTIAGTVRTHAGRGAIQHVVLTGGEPFLQLDLELLDVLRDAVPGATIAVETNGTRAPKHGVDVSKLWITLSPKVAPDRLVFDSVDELKVVFPAYSPRAYDTIRAKHRFVQPEATTTSVGVSRTNPSTSETAFEFVMTNPGWRLSLQTHKILGVP